MEASSISSSEPVHSWLINIDKREIWQYSWNAVIVCSLQECVYIADLLKWQCVHQNVDCDRRDYIEYQQQLYTSDRLHTVAVWVRCDSGPNCSS